MLTLKQNLVEFKDDKKRFYFKFFISFLFVGIFFISIALIVSLLMSDKENEELGINLPLTQAAIQVELTDLPNTTIENLGTQYDFNGIIENVPFISQVDLYPTGCESVSATMVLQYLGLDILAHDFINALPIADVPENGTGASPWEYFIGNPYSTAGYGCYAPVISQTANLFLEQIDYRAEDIYGNSLESLCDEYIKNGMPVLIWATMGMADVVDGPTWTLENGEDFTWLQPEHCLVLVGYDDEYYYFNDPLESAQVKYEKAAVELAYKSMGEQAVVFDIIE